MHPPSVKSTECLRFKCDHISSFMCKYLMLNQFCIFHVFIWLIYIFMNVSREPHGRLAFNQMSYKNGDSVFQACILNINSKHATRTKGYTFDSNWCSHTSHCKFQTFKCAVMAFCLVIEKQLHAQRNLHANALPITKEANYFGSCRRFLIELLMPA